MLNGRSPHGLATWNWDAGASHKGLAAIRHYANQPARPLWLLRQCSNFTSTYLFSIVPFNQEKALVGAFSMIVHCTTSPITRLQHYLRHGHQHAADTFVETELGSRIWLVIAAVWWRAVHLHCIIVQLFVDLFSFCLSQNRSLELTIINIQDDEKPYDIGNVQLCIQCCLTMTGPRTSRQRLIVVYDFIPREEGHTDTLGHTRTLVTVESGYSCQRDYTNFSPENTI